MSHYAGFVVSVGKKIRNPRFPSEYSYVEEVGCDYYTPLNLDGKELSSLFMERFPKTLDAAFDVLPGGVVRVIIPKGRVRTVVQETLNEIKKAAARITAEDLVHQGGPTYELEGVFKRIDPAGDICCALEGGAMSWTSFDRWLWGMMEANDAKDTVAYAYRAYDHHF